MANIYCAVYLCKSIKSIGMPGYNDVCLGLPNSSEKTSTDIIIKGTYSRFEVGKIYVISVQSVSPTERNIL